MWPNSIGPLSACKQLWARQCAAGLFRNIQYTRHERDKMGVEIETITPGDGKITLMHLLCCKVVYYLLSCVRLTALCYCSVSCSLFLLALLLQGGLSPKKDRHVWCIMLVSWISDVLLVDVLMLYFCEHSSLYGFLYMEMYNYWLNLERKKVNAYFQTIRIKITYILRVDEDTV